MKIYEKEELDQVKEALLSGKIIAFPTDTVFGLGCIANNPEAEKKIYQAKGRSFNKPLPMMCSDIEMIRRYALTDESSEILIRKLTPGALTIILKKKEEDSTIAIRIPDDEWILKLLKSLDCAMLVTSANISDKGSLREYTDVMKELDGRIDGIVKGNAESLISSTIVDCSEGIKILREGIIGEQDIREALNG